MRSNSGKLEQLRIAEPCNASWDRMEGDERVRFCADCRKNVYNLSAMSRAEAEALVFETEDRICVRFYQRRDGTVLTENCPVGVQRARLWLRVQIVGIAATLASLLSLRAGNPKDSVAPRGSVREPRVMMGAGSAPKDATGEKPLPPPPPEGPGIQ